MLVSLAMMLLALFLFILRFSPISSAVHPSFPHRWQNVAIGGGGYVTDIQIHPQSSETVYIQTDNGGFYRWNPVQQCWIPITDHFDRANKNFYGGAAIALDTQNPDTVLIAAGQYVSEGNGSVFVSHDRGQTWAQSNLSVPMGADQDKRWAGHRLAISPFDSNLVLFGSRQDGLWRSQDGGFTWSVVSDLQANPEYGIGILAIAFDPQQPNHIVIGAYGDGVHESVNNGQTWTKIPGAPSYPMQIAIDQAGELYVTSDHSPGVSVYRQNTWVNITPVARQSLVFNGLSVHPTHASEILISEGEDGKSDIFHTQTGGRSWTKLNNRSINSVPWQPKTFFRDHTSAVRYSMHSPQQVWLTDWFGVWRTNNIHSNPVRWHNYAKGLEQVVVFSLLAPPKGPPLFSGVADINGFRHDRLDQFPPQRLGASIRPSWIHQIDQDTYDFALSSTSPSHLIRTGGKRWNQTFSISYSDDSGKHWHNISNFPKHALPFRVAMSSNNPDNFVVVISESNALVTQDKGHTWQRVEGLPDGPSGPWNWVQPLVADGQHGNQYYYYASGNLYRSDDSGHHFSVIRTDLPATTDNYAAHSYPGCPNHLWLSLGASGLLYSQDAGETFTPISTVNESHLFALGINPLNPTQPIWYVYGKVNGQQGIFSSSNEGKSWINHSEVNVPVGAQPRIMEASQQHPGLIFIGTNGRGIYYKQVKP